MSKRISVFTILAALFALCLMAVAPMAFAGPDEAPGQAKKASQEDSDKDGDADSDPETAYTEDNDTNDGTANNVSDEGDNQHPSGKDRSVENGGSGNQGKSESHPDDTNGPKRAEGEAGSPDKPNGNGGTDLADQDGNNGCGNDDDFDDDNNGWCGKPAEADDDDVEGDVIVDKPCDADATMPGTQPCEKPDNPNKPCDADATMPGTQPCEDDDDEVLPGVVHNPVRPGGSGGQVAPDVVTNPATPEDEVLGEIITRDNGGPAVAAAVNPAVAAEGAATLPFTGGAVIPMVAIGLSLIAAGGTTTAVLRAKK